MQEFYPTNGFSAAPAFFLDELNWLGLVHAVCMPRGQLSSERFSQFVLGWVVLHTSTRVRF
jgi:hypothetical protein